MRDNVVTTALGVALGGAVAVGLWLVVKNQWPGVFGNGNGTTAPVVGIRNVTGRR